MVAVIKDRLAPLSQKGIKEVKFKSASYLMATGANGTISLSTRNFPSVSMTPAKDLLNAFKKLGTSRKLSFQEEYAMESLWHEIQHNNQKLSGRLSKSQLNIMETINQWVSRRTYPRMLTQLGGYKPQHLTKVKTDGYGYKAYVTRFDDLLKKLEINDAVLLGRVEEIHTGVDAGKYADEVSSLLAKESNKDKEKIKDCLQKIDAPTFEGALSAL